jgi:hypothetical protein
VKRNKNYMEDLNKVKELFIFDNNIKKEWFYKVK